MGTFRLLFTGDVFGRVGRRCLKEKGPILRQRYQPDIFIANGENAAGGAGLDASTAAEIFEGGVDVITSGNHIWHRREAFRYLDESSDRVIRPLNYSVDAPGKGWTIWRAPNGFAVGIANAVGRVFMPDLVDCPFRATKAVFENQLKDCVIKFLDFHAEATSEKVAMGHYLDGLASVVVGTHTHIQTADERILPGGTAYITDVGMCGPRDSVIGVEKSDVCERFLTGLPCRFEAAKGEGQLNGIVVDFDDNGRAQRLERINFRESEI